MILMLFLVAGEGLANLLHSPVPGAVWGMVGLWGALIKQWIDPAAVQAVAKGILGMMALFFVPPCLRILEHLPLLWPHALALVGIVTLSSLLSAGVTAWVYQRLAR